MCAGTADSVRGFAGGAVESQRFGERDSVTGRGRDTDTLVHSEPLSARKRLTESGRIAFRVAEPARGL